MIGKRLAAVVGLAAAIGWTIPALGNPRRVALIDVTADDTAVIRMRAELAAAGFTVVEVAPWSAEASPSDVARLLEPTGAVAAVRVGDDGTEVWLVDTRRHTTSLREVVLAVPTDTAEDSTIAVRAVEVVRAELDGARARKRRKRIVTDEIGPPEPPPEPQRRPVSFDLGFGFSASPGGVPVAPTFIAGARWMPIEHVGVGVLAVASPFHSTVKAAEGATSIWTGLAGAGLAVEATSSSATWGFAVEAGGAGGWLHLDGDAAPGFRSQSDPLAVGGPYLRPSLRWRLTPAFALRLDVIGAVVFPRPVVAFAGREVATWGRPVIASSLGVELSP